MLFRPSQPTQRSRAPRRARHVPNRETKTERTRAVREHRPNPLAGAAGVTRRQVTKSAAALGLLAFIAPACAPARSSEENGMADTIITNARVTTLDRANPDGQAVAVRDGRIQAVGPRAALMRPADPPTPLTAPRRPRGATD